MHARLVGTAQAQGGVFAAAQAMALGYSRDEIRVRLATGRWVRVRRGIYRAAGPVDERRVEAAAAVLACAHAVASHGTAAYLLSVPTLDADRRVDLTLPVESRTTSVKGCRVYHASLHGDCTVTDGIRTTTLVRTVIDLARWRRFADGVVAADHALRRGATHSELQRAARRIRGLPGEGSVQRVLGFASGKAESPGESLTRVLFDEHDLPVPELGVPVRSGGQLLGVVDFAWPGRGTVAEFDGRVKYMPDNDQGPTRLWHEKLREDKLRDAGLEVVRITWDDVTARPRDVVRRVRSAFARAEARRAAS